MKENETEVINPQIPTVENAPIEVPKQSEFIDPPVPAGLTESKKSTKERELDQGLQTTINKLDIALKEMQNNNFSYNKVSDMCKSVDYVTGATIGVNFYVYQWYSVDQARNNKNLTTDVGCDNYKDDKVDRLQKTTLYEKGGEIYLNEAEKIKKIQADLSNSINKVATEYENLVKNFQNISSELSQIKVPGIDLSGDFSNYARQIGKLKDKLLELTIS